MLTVNFDFLRQGCRDSVSSEASMTYLTATIRDDGLSLIDVSKTERGPETCVGGNKECSRWSWTTLKRDERANSSPSHNPVSLLCSAWSLQWYSTRTQWYMTVARPCLLRWCSCIYDSRVNIWGSNPKVARVYPISGHNRASCGRKIVSRLTPRS